jgi:hypothetical protein
MKTKLILSMAVGFTLFACDANPTENKTLVIEEETFIAEDNHLHEEEEAILLDDGKKWAVVPDMLGFIRTMETGVEAVGKKESAVTADYQALAVLIDENIRALTSNCTMTGQAHDELHKWLVPLITISEAFDEAKELETQESIFQEIKKSYETFNLYFE